jgi:hypothetical protein
METEAEIAVVTARLAATVSQTGPDVPVVLAGIPMAEQTATKPGLVVQKLPA